MAEVSLAGKLKVPVAQLQALFSGDVLPGVAARVGQDVPTVQAFVDGDIRHGMAGALGLSASELEVVSRNLRQQGRIGLLIGGILCRKRAGGAA